MRALTAESYLFYFERGPHDDPRPAGLQTHPAGPMMSVALVETCHRDHGSMSQASVCTSTDSTAGRSRTIGAQLSPASADAYTCPPVVPKYTPHLSSESTAIASRNTFT